MAWWSGSQGQSQTRDLAELRSSPSPTTAPQLLVTRGFLVKIQVAVVVFDKKEKRTPGRGADGSL